MSLARRPDELVREIADEAMGTTADLESDPDFAALTEQQKVETLSYLNWSRREIADQLGLERERVRIHQKRVARQMERYGRELPEVARAYQVRKLRKYVDRIEGAVDRLVPEGRETTENAVNLKLLNVAIRALESERDITLGMKAPVQSQSVNLNVSASASRHQNQAILNDPVIRDLYLQAERRQREIESAQPLPLAGPVRGTGQQGPVEVHPAPGTPERPDDPGGGGGDRPPGHLHAPEAREGPGPGYTHPDSGRVDDHG